MQHFEVFSGGENSCEGLYAVVTQTRRAAPAAVSSCAKAKRVSFGAGSNPRPVVRGALSRPARVSELLSFLRSQEAFL